MGDESSRESSKRKWFEDLKKSKAAELEALGLDPTQACPTTYLAHLAQLDIGLHGELANPDLA